MSARRFPAVAVICVAALLAGCQLAPPTKPDAVVPASWRAPAMTARSLGDFRCSDIFLSDELDALLREALAANADLAIALQRVELARSQFGIQRSAVFPQVGGTLSSRPRPLSGRQHRREPGVVVVAARAVGRHVGDRPLGAGARGRGGRTVIVAEDLGTIGERVREELLRRRMLSYRLLYFERNYPEPSFTPPEHYPEISLCAVTTHDLPTLSGYWSGHDLKTREELGLLPHEEACRQQMKTRERDKSLILSALAAQGLLPEGYAPEDPESAEMTPALCLAVYRYLSRTPCKILLVSLDDLIGTLMQQNMPGVTDLYPNWMQKTLLTVEDIVSDARLTALSQMLQESRSRHFKVPRIELRGIPVDERLPWRSFEQEGFSRLRNHPLRH